MDQRTVFGRKSLFCGSASCISSVGYRSFEGHECELRSCMYQSFRWKARWDMCVRRISGTEKTETVWVFVLVRHLDAIYLIKIYFYKHNRSFNSDRKSKCSCTLLSVKDVFIKCFLCWFMHCANEISWLFNSAVLYRVVVRVNKSMGV